MNKFKGTITSVNLKKGTSTKGDWASVEFEVTESNPENQEYPQIGLFDMFKNGDNIKYATGFEETYPIGTEVNVEFHLKKNTYTKKDGTQGAFYKTSCWRCEKVGLEPGVDGFPGKGEDDGLPDFLQD